MSLSIQPGGMETPHPLACYNKYIFITRLFSTLWNALFTCMGFHSVTFTRLLSVFG